MKMYFQKLLTALVFCTLLQTSFAQVMDPSDPVVEYSGGNIQQPNFGQVGDWVKTTSLNWNTEDYKCYIYKGHIFRLKFPTTYQHNVNDGKTYPLYVFFHGLGEAAAEDEVANLYDNEYQMFHGGERHKNAVNDTTFDGFLLFMQNQWGFFGAVHYDAIAELIENFLVPQNKVDINRVTVNGLSGGGMATWEFAIRHPRLTAGCLPISAASYAFQNSRDILKYIPIWHFQGGQDKNPAPQTSETLGNAILQVGGSYKYTLYPNRGHSCWNDSWSEDDFYPFLLRAHKANPVPLFGKYEFCVGENVNLTLGLTAGFDGYQWRKNGEVIPGATSNTYTISGSQAATFGTYDCRIRRGTTWSVWSPAPIIVKLKDPTVAPDITTAGLMTRVIPDPNGESRVVLKQPLGYNSYSWTRVGNNTVLGTADSLVVTTTGNYVVKVTEQFGCLSEFSNPFSVINANGPNKPDAPSGVILTPVSMTQMKIDWSDNPNPDHNETNFEVYQSQTSGGPWKLVGITGQDITTFTVNGLTEGTKYYYIVRSVNNTGASAITSEVSAFTTPDNTPPTAPGMLVISNSDDNSVSLEWEESTDNIGVEKYDIYINGIKSYVTDDNDFTCYNLSVADSGYTFIVKARDAAGNVSLPSNQVFGIPPVNVTPVPAMPTNIVATPVSHKRINVSWTDNSNNETNFEILRSTNSNNGFYLIGNVPANTTSFVDSVGLNPSTAYYYRVRAAYEYGGSIIKGIDIQANWKLNNNYSDASGNNQEISGSGTTFISSDKMEGSHSLNFNGVSQYVDVDTDGGDYLRGGYDTKTIAFWMKSNSNTGMRIIFDFGGSDDGLVMGLESNFIFAGVARSNNRAVIMAPYSSLAWNHIALVLNGNTIRLYINGVEVASNLDLPFDGVGSTSNGSRIGTVNGSHALAQGAGFFSGRLDDFNIFESALTQSQINNVANNLPALQIPQGNATTLALPATPSLPSNLVASGISSSTNQLSWNDNSSDETSFKVYKSDDDSTNYVLLATLPANTTSYTDEGLFPSSVRYYKVSALNAIGSGGFSNQDSAATWAPVPVITDIPTTYMRYGSTLNIPVNAVSPLNGNINLQVNNLPSFGSFTPTGNGTGNITFTNPSFFQQNTYNITIVATDPFGSSSLPFTLVVNDNYVPTLDPVNNVNIDEDETTQITLVAMDFNFGDVLTYSFTGLPGFVTVTPNGNDAVLDIEPGFADHGVYNVVAKVDDGNTGSATRNFTITVNDIFPNKRIYVNFTDGSLPVGAPWNGTNKMPALNDNFTAFEDENGNTTAVGLRIITPWGAIGNGSNVLGVNTGNNSGVYPDAVIRSAYWTDAAHPQTLRLYGLDINKKYSFTFFGSRGNVTGNRTSLYTINGTSVSLNAAGNSDNTVNMTNVEPQPDGTLDLVLSNAPGSAYGYLNAMVIEEIFDDGSVPAKPREITADLAGSQAQLNWIDAAYNETAYEVYRSDDIAGTFVLINPGGNNSNIDSYNDNNISGNTTYYYTVRAINSYGASDYSDTVSVTTGNGTPELAPISNVTMRIQEVEDILLTVADEPGDVITFTGSNLPPFATLTDNGDGTGVLHIAPGSSVGIFNNVTITATDDKGASTNRTFRIIVRDVFNSVYVNFSHTTNYAAPSPWNSFTSVPFTNKALVNMIDDSETPSGITITQLTNWEGANDQGTITGTNTGVFPDNVMRTVYYTSSSTPMRLRISGLDTGNKKYNLVFFASRQAGDNRNTVYTANGNSVTLNAANNTTNTVQLNGLEPDANGIIEFTCTKAAGSPYAYLGAVVIQSYEDNGLPFAPSNLVAVARSKTSIELNWSDKSSDEDGFEVLRSESYNGTFTVLHTTAPGVTTYLDTTGLVFNKIYYYKVRGKKGTVFSEFTNTVSTSTYIFSVYVNFNRQNNASSPWNNTRRAPEEGRDFELDNDLGNETGIEMEIVDNFNFSGDNPSGMNTGNNSGIYPDNVLRSSWWVDVGVVSKLRISNLNQDLEYSFIFLGSRDGGGNRTSVYTIDGKSVSLNAAFNTTQTVQIDNVRPDENGEVIVTVSLAQYAMFAYINSMVIHGYKIGTDEGDQSRGGTDVVYPQPTNNTNTNNAITLEAKNSQPVLTEMKISVYPNPFNDQLTVAANFDKKQSVVTIRLIDVTGRTVHQESFRNLPEGAWTTQLDLKDRNLAPGVYSLQLISSESIKPDATFKLVKTK